MVLQILACEPGCATRERPDLLVPQGSRTVDVYLPVMGPARGCSMSRAQVSLALMDRVLSVDVGRRQVTVQAGARVQEVRRWKC